MTFLFVEKLLSEGVYSEESSCRSVSKIFEACRPADQFYSKKIKRLQIEWRGEKDD